MADTEDTPADEDAGRPSLHLVTDPDDVPVADAPDREGDHTGGARVEDAARRRSRARRSRPTDESEDRPQDPLEQARAVLDEADPEGTYKMLLSLARAGQSDVLQPLDYNSALEFHDPTRVKVDPDPSGLDAVDLYTRAAFPDFDRLLLDAFLDPRNDHLLNHLRHLLFTERQNVALVTNHGQIIDIALVIGALLIAVCNDDRTFGVLGARVGLPEFADRVNVLVSRMVATRQALGVPAMQVLQIGARTFLTIPQTQSRRRAKLDPELAKANNIVMRHELDLQMAKGGQLLAMAASGSQDLSLAAGLMQKARVSWLKRRGEEPPEEASTLHLQPLYDGTISLMTACRYVLPVAISLDPAAPACALGEMTKLHERDDCHRVMDWIAEAHQEATGVPTIYHWHEDDLLTQVRALADSLRR